MAQFEPIHDAHAIEQVLMVFQVAQPIADLNFKQALVAADGFRNELPGISEIQNFTFGFVPGVALGAQASVPHAGRILARSRPDGTVENELRVERTTISFRTTAYTRWDGVWGNANRYFEALIPIYANEASIAAASLNFIDKFRWDGATEQPNAVDLFRPGSSFVAPHVSSSSEMWHSHTGIFQRVDANTKRLLNVNADCLDENVGGEIRRTISITTLLTDMLNQEGFAPLQVAKSDAHSFFERKMSSLHAASKKVFGEIISDRMAQRIALNL